MNPKWQYTKNNREEAEKLKEKYNVNFLIYGNRKNIIIYPFILIINTFISLFYFLKFKPDIIISTGAHTAGPMLVIGKLFKKNIIFVETMANINRK